MKVAFSRLAASDLRAIASWIFGDRPNAAGKVIRGLQIACAALALKPYAYQLVKGREADGVRRAPFSRYLILYRVEAEQISIVRILDGARDAPSLL